MIAGAERRGAVMRIALVIGGRRIAAELNDSATAEKLAAALPFTGRGSYWGDEFYFSIPVRAELDEDASDVVEPGTIAFWVEGSCLAIFWGPTPMSRGGECRAASPVNVVGRVDDWRELQGLRGSDVRVELI